MASPESKAPVCPLCSERPIGIDDICPTCWLTLAKLDEGQHASISLTVQDVFIEL